MININFKIDKETAFAYWIQSIIEWGLFFEENNYKYYRNLIGKLSKQEEETLKELKSVITKENNKFLWLWNRYTKKNIEDKYEKEVWEKTKKTFQSKFNKVWEKESKQLEKWRGTLESYNFTSIEKSIYKIEKFFDSKTPKEIETKLILHYNKDLPTGHVKKEFENVILVKLSNLEINEINRNKVIGTTIHEIIHKIEKKSHLEKILKESYTKHIVPTDIKLKGGYKWKYLLKESIITSIIGKILNKNKTINTIRSFDISEEIKKLNYGFLIRYISKQILPKTTEYIEKGKTLDKEYTNYVVKEWVSLLK